MSHIRIPADRIGLALAISGLLLLPARSVAQPYNIVPIDVPCADCPGGIARSTSAMGINPAGDIVGWYADNLNHQHGYIFSGGQFTTLDVPGALAGVGGTLPTMARGISPSGEIVGSYTVPVSTASYGSPEYCTATYPATCIKGFLYSHGRFSTVLFPLPAGGYHAGAIPQRIGPDGDIYGCLHDNDTGMSMFGAVWSRFGDVSLTANGGELVDSDPLATTGVPVSMNDGATPDGHTIVGGFANHGFVVQNGSFRSYDVPASTSTDIWDINPVGAFVGVYHDTRNHGFVQLPDGSAPISLDPQNSVGATAIGINPGGIIVGQYTDTNGHLHGFVAVPTVSN